MDEYLVIRNLVNEDKFEEAIKRAEEIKDEHKKSMTLCMIAEAMIYEGRKKEAILLLDEAFKIAKETKDGLWKSLSISKIAFTLAVAGKVSKALKIADNIELHLEKVYAMVRISHLLANRNKVEEANKVLKEAKEIIDEIRDDISKIVLIENIAYAFVKIGEIGKAWDLMERVKIMAEKLEEDEASMAYTLTIQFMIEIGKLNEALELIENMMNEYDKAWLISDVAYMKRDMDLLMRAFKIAKKMEDSYEKVSIMTKIASIMSELEKKKEADELIKESIKILEKLKDKIERAMAFAVISHAMFKNGNEGFMSMLNEAIKMAKELESIEKEHASSLIAHILIEVGRFEEAMNFINEMEEEIRTSVYISIAEDLIDEGRREEAMKIAEFMNDRLLRGRIRG